MLQENILAESSAMIPDTRQRLEQACEQLQAALVGAWPGGWGRSGLGLGSSRSPWTPPLHLTTGGRPSKRARGGRGAGGAPARDRDADWAGCLRFLGAALSFPHFRINHVQSLFVSAGNRMKGPN